MSQRQRQRDATRQRIVEAAARDFARHGYAGSSFASIAQELGRPRSAISYQLFPSKTLLARAVMDEYLDRLAGVLNEVSVRERVGLDALVAALRTVGCLVAECPASLGALRLLMEQYDAADPVRTAVVFGFVDDNLRAAYDAGDLSREMDQAAVAQMLLVGALGAHSALIFGIGSIDLLEALRASWEGVFRTAGVPERRIAELLSAPFDAAEPAGLPRRA